MKRLTLALVINFLCFSSFAKSNEPSNLSDISFSFDQSKVDASEDSFHFLRSFVGYYYGLLSKNSAILNISTKTSRTPGWCVGDSHAENYGILIQENLSVMFTMNDLDDSGPCPVAYDFLRILVSSRLYLPSINIDDIVKSYKDGLAGNKINTPSSIISLSKDAIKKGTDINSSKLDGNKLKRNKDSSEVDSTLKQTIVARLESTFSNEKLKVLDIIATSKVGGGSGGLQRYEVLIKNNENSIILLELKELVEPSIAVVKTAIIPDQSSRIKKGLQFTQGNGFSHYYNVFIVGGKSMLLRPKFAGNLGITLADSNSNDNQEIILFEAYVLGRIHAGSVNTKNYLADLENMKKSDWESDVDSLVKLFINKYDLLKK
ncbi:MAG: DUF2252 family protein [Bacteriovorax sp.]|nr:DUF2252 family protein [Bacteriovorax sp.]